MKNLHQSKLYQGIQKVLQQARQKVAVSINFAMVETYRQIGQMIVEEEQEGKDYAVYGSKLIPKLSEELTKEFGTGFNRTNLSLMRRFYLNFQNFHAVRKNLSWTHYHFLPKKSE